MLYLIFIVWLIVNQYFIILIIQSDTFLTTLPALPKGGQLAPSTLAFLGKSLALVQIRDHCESFTRIEYTPTGKHQSALRNVCYSSHYPHQSCTSCYWPLQVFHNQLGSWKIDPVITWPG